jgi:hypothetical protein
MGVQLGQQVRGRRCCGWAALHDHATWPCALHLSCKH